MKPLKTSALGVILGVFLLSGCETTSAALDGVGGVFVGAGQDVRSLGRR
jgi:predicted small secreted protein